MTKSTSLLGTLSVWLSMAISTPALAVEPFALNWQQQGGSLNGIADFSVDAGGQFCSPCATARPIRHRNEAQP
ncbi:MAG: hypothetical protein HYX62_05240 [Gammaproteobacteria bacterium]|nr:hypothetical protein [Gammaproteobacteria bacterium]